jgi:hypothetical protein
MVLRLRKRWNRPRLVNDDRVLVVHGSVGVAMFYPKMLTYCIVYVCSPMHSYAS